MEKNRRNLVLDVFDYAGNMIERIYDSSRDTLGQPSDIFISTSRNGWKELSFTMPDTVTDTREGGWTPNERAEALKADYRIRATDDSGEDWFIISEPRIAHNGLTKTVSVTAGHVSQTLKTKNLGLEFSDDEGNNVGTAAELLDVILEGTGWTAGDVDEFLEKDGTVKRRSLRAAARTGAFNLVAKMCALFDAKPIYHGGSRTVDIKPLNPFSEPKDGSLPDVAYDDVVELHYGKNVKNVTRVSNTENLVTKLQAQGSWGDDVSGQCGIDECVHRVWRFEDAEIVAGNEYAFVIDDDGTGLAYYFTATENGSAADYIYSDLDPASRMYVYDTENEKACFVTRKPTKSAHTLLAAKDPTEETNVFPFLLDFDYQNEAGLLTDDMLRVIADYQIGAAEKTREAGEAAKLFADGIVELGSVIGVVDLCRLGVLRYGRDESGYVTIELDTQRYDGGVIWTSQYDVKKDKRFKWRVTEALNDKGDPTTTGTSAVYIIHAGTPVTWDKVWIRAIDNEDAPTKITLWTTKTGDLTGDRVYLFSSNNVNGYLGAYETADESALFALEAATKVVTENHRVWFEKTEPDVPVSHQWWWKISDNEDSCLYFCWPDEGDETWKYVWLTSDKPFYVEGDYWYDWRSGALYKGVPDQSDGSVGEWRLLDSESEKRVANVFSSVWRLCMTRDKQRKGQYDFQRHHVSGTLGAGNYAFDDGYGTQWLFSTENGMSAGDLLEYSTGDKWVNAVTDGVSATLESKSYRFDALDWHPANLCESLNLSAGGLDVSDGTETRVVGCSRTSNIRVQPNCVYEAEEVGARSIDICFYDEKNRFISGLTVTGDYEFSTPTNTRYMRLACYSFDGLVIHAENWDGSVIADEKIQTVLQSVTDAPNQLKSIPNFIRRFADLGDEVYGNLRAQTEAAQTAVKEMDAAMRDGLGDLQREGWWQKNDYVDGDEKKLYEDALDNIRQASKPDIRQEIGWIDLYGAENFEGGNLWPDVSSAMAAHLIDPELGINTWAQIDSVKKCQDCPWKTSISINTNLTLINQHTFADVMSRLAEAAGEMNAKQTKYDRAVTRDGNGLLSTKSLQGTIDANALKITGGSSTWQTDEKGNMVFVSANGENAMTITGNGFAIANSKNKQGEWNWRTFGTGEGFTADEIVTGFLSAERIAARSITARHLSSDVGESLDLSSNVSIKQTVEQVYEDVDELVGYRLEIMSTSDILSSDIQTTTLSARVWHGNEDATGNFSASRFKWKRVSADSSADEMWNSAHRGMKSITLGVRDVAQSATYSCELTDI